MRATRRTDTAAELAVRNELDGLGVSYECNASILPGSRRSADLIIRSIPLAIFIDGCFWHGCPQHATWPRANAAFWEAKITGNQQRDAESVRALAAAGWTTVRFWEHEDPRRVAEQITAMVRDGD